MLGHDQLSNFSIPSERTSDGTRDHGQVSGIEAQQYAATAIDDGYRGCPGTSGPLGWTDKDGQVGKRVREQH